MLLAGAGGLRELDLSLNGIGRVGAGALARGVSTACGWLRRWDCLKDRQAEMGSDSDDGGPDTPSGDDEEKPTGEAVRLDMYSFIPCCVPLW